MGHEMSRRSLLMTGPALLVKRPRMTGQDAGSSLSALRAVSATLVADALSRLGHDRSHLEMSSTVKPVFPIKGTVAGPAVTTLYEKGEGATADAIREHMFQPVDNAAPGSVWVIASGTELLLSMLGEHLALACRKKGFQGVVTDSGCRDLVGLEETGLPIFARNTCLFGPGSHIRPVAANVKVDCGGIEVGPGDIVVADANGVLAFPEEALSDVVRVMRELQQKEEATRLAIERGEPLTRAYRF